MRPTQPHAAAAPARSRRRAAAVELSERAVVAGRDERVVDGRVEAAVGPLAGVEREPDDLEELVAGIERPASFRRDELRVGRKRERSASRRSNSASTSRTRRLRPGSASRSSSISVPMARKAGVPSGAPRGGRPAGARRCRTEGAATGAGRRPGRLRRRDLRWRSRSAARGSRRSGGRAGLPVRARRCEPLGPAVERRDARIRRRASAGPRPRGDPRPGDEEDEERERDRVQAGDVASHRPVRRRRGSSSPSSAVVVLVELVVVEPCVVARCRVVRRSGPPGPRFGDRAGDETSRLRRSAAGTREAPAGGASRRGAAAASARSSFACATASCAVVEAGRGLRAERPSSASAANVPATAATPSASAMNGACALFIGVLLCGSDPTVGRAPVRARARRRSSFVQAQVKLRKARARPGARVPRCGAMRILIVEDEDAIADPLAEGLGARASRSNGSRPAAARSRRPSPTSCCSTCACPTWTGSRCAASSERARPCRSSS